MWHRVGLGIALVAVSVLGFSCTGEVDVDEGCTDGGSVSCTCPDGTVGTRDCEPEGTFGPCSCDAASDAGNASSDAGDTSIADLGGSDGDAGGITDGTPLYSTYELTFENSDVSGNRFLEYVDVTFEKDGRTFEVDGFYDGDDTWIARFMPDEKGRWSYEWSFQGDSGSGTFVVTDKTNSDNHGHVQVDPDHPRYLKYDDGTPHYFYGAKWIGDSEYGPSSKGEESHENRVSDEEFSDYLDVLKSTGHNGILVKTQLHPLGIEDTEEKIRWDVDWIGRADWLVRKAAERGIYVQINLFDVWSRDKDTWFENAPGDTTQHVFDVWNDGDEKAKENYIRYLVARFSGYYNVYWELGNELGHGFRLDNLDDSEQAFIDQADKYLNAFEEYDPYDLPIGVSGGPGSARMYEDIDVDIGFPHGGWTASTPRSSEPKPVITNEVTQGNLWGTSDIEDPDNRWKYRATFWRVFTLGGSGASEATHLDITEPLDETTKQVMRDHGRLRSTLEKMPVSINEMERLDSFVESGPGETSARGVDGEAYLAYFLVEANSRESGTVRLNVPSGDYEYRWIEPSSGDAPDSGTVTSSGGSTSIDHPSFDHDLVLRIVSAS